MQTYRNHDALNRLASTENALGLHTLVAERLSEEAQLLLQGMGGVFRVHHHDMQQRCPVVHLGKGFF